MWTHVSFLMGTAQGLGVTRVSLCSAFPSDLSRQRRNLWNILRQLKCTNAEGERGFNYSPPPSPVLSFPTQKSSGEQTRHIGPKRTKPEPLWLQPVQAVELPFARGSDALSRAAAPCLCGKACKTVSIQLLQLPLTRLPKHIFHPFLTEASV